MALPTGTNGTPAPLQTLHTDDTFYGFSSKSLEITAPGPLCLATPQPVEPPLCEDPRPDRVFFICSVFSSVALISFSSFCLAVLSSDRPSRSHPVVPDKVAEVGQEAGRQLGGV